MNHTPKGGMIIPATVTDEHFARLAKISMKDLFPNLSKYVTDEMGQVVLTIIYNEDLVVELGYYCSGKKAIQVKSQVNNSPGTALIPAMMSRIEVDADGTVLENLWVHPQEVLDTVFDTLNKMYGI